MMARPPRSMGSGTPLRSRYGPVLLLLFVAWDDADLYRSANSRGGAEHNRHLHPRSRGNIRVRNLAGDGRREVMWLMARRAGRMVGVWSVRYEARFSRGRSPQCTVDRAEHILARLLLQRRANRAASF